MEHLENDMDDLFQKAGELYPLKITGSDWDAVAGKLQTEEAGEIHELNTSAAANSRRRRWLLLLLLIPLGMGIYYFSGNVHQGKQNSISVKGPGGSADHKEISSPVAGGQMPVAEAAGSNKANAGGNSSANATNNNKAATPDNAVVRSGEKVNAYRGGGNAGSLAGSHKMTNTFGGKTSSSDKGQNRQNQISSNAKSDLNSNPGAAKETKTTDTDKKSGDDASPSDQSVSKAAVAVAPSALSTQNPAAANHSDKTETSKKAAADSSGAKKKTNTALKQSKGFYVGLFAGPDVSTVKFQQVNNLGFSLGALIGYRFNNRLSLETGVTWDKKYYYSVGEYYKGVTLPANTTLNGNCSMFEIPVDIRFDFATKKNHGYFAKAGLSSYLMTSENYTFNYPGYSRPWKNDTLKNNIFSILQISGGYERVINDKTKMRVEPYVKIPLQGIGKGDMPIASFGIYIGITHSFR